MPTETKSKSPRVSSVPAWGIEADHPRNSDLALQSVTGLRLRSAINASRTVKDSRTGEELVPIDQASGLGRLPAIPGMQLHVNPGQGTYVVIDPLYEDQELCSRIQRRIEQLRGTSMGATLRGVPPIKGRVGEAGFDEHRMKTLCREMYWLVTSGEARVIKGPLPDLEDIEDLPGHFLLNPGSRVANTQPRFEKDWAAWMDNLVRSGG